MIKQIIINNFQSHKKTDLKLSKGINMIIGQSDSGKTAILRALNWLVNNRPGGEAFRSRWGGDTEVILNLKDGTEVQRYKTKQNGYALKPSNHTFVSFGQDVPKTIKDLLNISEINLQTQFEAPFLLSKSSGEVAKFLNKVVNLDKIDIANTNISKSVREEKRELDYLKDKKKELIEKKKEYDWVKEFEKEVTSLATLNNKIEESINIYNDLCNILQDIEETEEEMQDINKVVKHEKKAKELATSLVDISLSRQIMESLAEVIKQVKLIKNTIKELDTIKMDGEKEFKKLMPDICPLCGRSRK